MLGRSRPLSPRASRKSCGRSLAKTRRWMNCCWRTLGVSATLVGCCRDAGGNRPASGTLEVFWLMEWTQRRISAQELRVSRRRGKMNGAWPTDVKEMYAKQTDTKRMGIQHKGAPHKLIPCVAGLSEESRGLTPDSGANAIPKSNCRLPHRRTGQRLWRFRCRERCQ